MDKIKIEITAGETKTVKLGKYRVEVKQSLGAKDIMLINDMCLKQFKSAEDNEKKIAGLPLVMVVFDMLVTELATNLSFDGVETITDIEKTVVDVNLTEGAIEDFSRSGVASIVRKYVSNYDYAWGCVLESIRLQTTLMGLGLIADTIPSEKKIKEGIDATMGMIKELKEKEPELMDAIVKTSQQNNIITTAKEDFAKSKAKKKEESLNKKK